MKLLKFYLLISILLLGAKSMADTKNKWPVANLTFEFVGKNGWTPNKVTVPEGAEVNLKLFNKSPSTACFGIYSKDNKAIKKDECIQANQTKEIRFFANHEAGDYQIRNTWESSQPGVFTILKSKK